MNDIYVTGQLKNIEYSHSIEDIIYNKAILVCKRPNSDKEDSLNIKFKALSNTHKEGDIISVKGNLRSFSQKLSEDKNKVTVYIFTYFDSYLPEDLGTNNVTINGTICKINPIRTTQTGKHNIHFILANNLLYDDNKKRLNSYIPCIAWGKVARELENLSVGTKLILYGELHSREHKKVYPNGECEFRVAHELHVNSFEVVK